MIDKRVIEDRGHARRGEPREDGHPVGQFVVQLDVATHLKDSPRSVELVVRSKCRLRRRADAEVGEAVGAGARLADGLGRDVDQCARAELDVFAVDFDPAPAGEVHVHLLLPRRRLAVPMCRDVRWQFEDLAAECGDPKVFAGKADGAAEPRCELVDRLAYVGHVAGPGSVNIPDRLIACR